jgi:hypothetical protein
LTRDWMDELYNGRIVVPKAAWREILRKLHWSHPELDTITLFRCPASIPLYPQFFYPAPITDRISGHIFRSNPDQRSD